MGDCDCATGGQLWQPLVSVLQFFVPCGQVWRTMSRCKVSPLVLILNILCSLPVFFRLHPEQVFSFYVYPLQLCGISEAFLTPLLGEDI